MPATNIKFANLRSMNAVPPLRAQEQPPMVPDTPPIDPDVFTRSAQGDGVGYLRFEDAYRGCVMKGRSLQSGLSYVQSPCQVDAGRYDPSKF